MTNLRHFMNWGQIGSAWAWVTNNVVCIAFYSDGNLSTPSHPHGAPNGGIYLADFNLFCGFIWNLFCGFIWPKKHNMTPYDLGQKPVLYTRDSLPGSIPQLSPRGWGSPVVHPTGKAPRWGAKWHCWKPTTLIGLLTKKRPKSCWMTTLTDQTVESPTLINPVTTPQHHNITTHDVAKKWANAGARTLGRSLKRGSLYRLSYEGVWWFSLRLQGGLGGDEDCGWGWGWFG